jgi:DNA polymerase III subunit delta
VRIAQESLASALARGLRGAYLVTGAEPLLMGEACDQIREAARGAGYTVRETYFLERGFDWNRLLAGLDNLSLFGERRLIELRLAASLDAAAARSLTALAERPPPDTVLLVSGELERRSQQAAWVQAFERAAALIVTRPVGREELPGWIATRLARRGVTLDAPAARLLAARVEGNLLAAQQEVERIALARPGGSLDEAAVAALVADSARYDVFELATAAFAGEAPRALKLLAGLRAEGQEPPLLLWALTDYLRALSRLAHRLERTRSVDEALRAERVWVSRQPALRAAALRLSRPAIDALLAAAARADRIAKGAVAGDPWLALEALTARVAGVRLAA